MVLLGVRARLRVGAESWGQRHRTVCVRNAGLSFNTKVQVVPAN